MVEREVQDIGLRKAGHTLRAVHEILRDAGLVVAELEDVEAAELRRRIVAELLHQSGDLLEAVDTLHCDRVLGLFVVAVLLVDIQHLIPERQALLLVEGGGFAEHHDRARRVLVSRVRAGKAAVALFQAEDIVVGVLLLEDLDLLADVLEAGQDFLVVQAVVFRDASREVRRDDRGDERRILGHRVREPALPEDVFRDQHAGHVAGETDVLAGLRILRVDAETVRVGIGREDDVSVLFLRELECQREGLRILGVRIIQRREVAVGLFLLRNDVDLLEAELLQDARDGDEARAVERRVDDLDVVRHLADDFGMDDLLLQRFHVRVVDFLAEVLQKALLQRFLFGHRLHVFKALNCVDFRDDTGVMRRRHLRAVLPVRLVSVVLRRVVARRDLDAGLAAEITEREGLLRHAAQRVGQIRLDAVRCEAKGRLLRELGGHVPAVVRDRDAAGRIAVLIDVVGEALRRLADRVDVHAVRAGADDAAQAARTKGQARVEAVLDFLLIVADREQLLLRRIVEIRVAQPALKFFFCGFVHALLQSCYLLLYLSCFSFRYLRPVVISLSFPFLCICVSRVPVDQFFISVLHLQ